MEIPRHWRLKAQRYRMEGSLCPLCGEILFPPRPVCPHCRSQLGQLALGQAVILAAPTGLTTVDAQSKYRITERIVG